MPRPVRQGLLAWAQPAGTEAVVERAQLTNSGKQSSRLRADVIQGVRCIAQRPSRNEQDAESSITHINSFAFFMTN